MVLNLVKRNSLIRTLGLFEQVFVHGGVRITEGGTVPRGFN
jgi:hypothetical protein